MSHVDFKNCQYFFLSFSLFLFIHNQLHIHKLVFFKSKMMKDN